VGRRASAYWLFLATANVTANANFIVTAPEIAYAYAPEIAYDISRILFTPKLIDEYVQLVNLFAQYRIVSRVNFFQLIADLEALKQNIPDDKATKKERREFADQLFEVWNTAFNLTKLLNLSTYKFDDINKDYFYINRRILYCQKVAVNISPTVWQEIEERMLRVP
ncbi:MAG: NACHT C-terminal helical domain 2-containing protein, partial [Microcystis panniformis]